MEALRRHHLDQVAGADLTKLPGLDVLAVQRILSEVGLDMSRWSSEKHFCAWLNVTPNNRISGGEILSSKPRKMPIALRRLCALLLKVPWTIRNLQRKARELGFHITPAIPSAVVS